MVVLPVLTAAALAVVLPALAIEPGGEIPPPSGQSITPTLVDVGGSNFDCQTNAGAPPGTVQFQISKPTPGTYTDPTTGVSFVITGPEGPGNLDPKSFFSFTTDGAATVLHVGVNGGTNTAWYDYEGGSPSEAYVSGGVSYDKNLHSTPADGGTGKKSWYVASITTFCYVPVTVEPSCTEPFDGISFSGTTEYTAQLQSPDGVLCKDEAVVMYTAADEDGVIAALHETPGAAGDVYWVIERIRWTKTGSTTQNPYLIKYDDVYPYDTPVDVKMCTADLRSDDWTVSVTPTGTSDADAMMPGTPDTETTCMIQSTDLTGGQYEAWLLSSVDGYRWGG